MSFGAKEQVPVDVLEGLKGKRASIPTKDKKGTNRDLSIAEEAL